jgi:hypothetical protein
MFLLKLGHLDVVKFNLEDAEFVCEIKIPENDDGYPAWLRFGIRDAGGKIHDIRTVGFCSKAKDFAVSFRARKDEVLEIECIGENPCLYFPIRDFTFSLNRILSSDERKILDDVRRGKIPTKDSQ